MLGDSKNLNYTRDLESKKPLAKDMRLSNIRFLESKSVKLDTKIKWYRFFKLSINPFK